MLTTQGIYGTKERERAFRQETKAQNLTRLDKITHVMILLKDAVSRFFDVTNHS